MTNIRAFIPRRMRNYAQNTYSPTAIQKSLQKRLFLIDFQKNIRKFNAKVLAI